MGQQNSNSAHDIQCHTSTFSYDHAWERILAGLTFFWAVIPLFP